MADKLVTKRHQGSAASKPKSAAYRLKLGPSLDTMRKQISGGLVTGGSLRELRLVLELTLADVAHVLGASERSVMRKEQSGAPLTVAEADRVYRLARVADLAAELIGDADRAIRWLKTPHRYLGDKTPISMLDTEIGTDLVIESLFTIAYGGVA